jgi:hypothetical protein
MGGIVILMKPEAIIDQLRPRVAAWVHAVNPNT